MFEEIFRSEMARTITISMLTAFFTSFLTYFFAIRTKKVDRHNKIEDPLVERRMAVYKQAEDIAYLLYQSTAVPYHLNKCALYEKKLFNRWGQTMNLATHFVYSDIDRIIEFDEKVLSVLSNSLLIDLNLERWIRFLHMYNSNMVLAYKNRESKKIEDLLNHTESYKEDDVLAFFHRKYLGLLGYFDCGLIGSKIMKSIRIFYASKNKTVFRNRFLDADIFNFLQVLSYSRRLNMRKFGLDKKNRVNKIVATCWCCIEDCILSGKNYKPDEEAINQESCV